MRDDRPDIAGPEPGDRRWPPPPGSRWRWVGFVGAGLGSAAVLFGLALAGYDNGNITLLTQRQAVVELVVAAAAFGLSVYGLRLDTRGHELVSRALMLAGAVAGVAWYVLILAVY